MPKTKEVWIDQPIEKEQEDHFGYQAGLLVLYPQPITLTIGDGEHVYPILALYADPAHIRDFADSLQFEVTLFGE